MGGVVRKRSVHRTGRPVLEWEREGHLAGPGGPLRIPLCPREGPGDSATLGAGCCPESQGTLPALRALCPRASPGTGLSTIRCWRISSTEELQNCLAFGHDKCCRPRRGTDSRAARDKL